MKLSTKVWKTARKNLYVSNFEGVDTRYTESLSRGANVKNLISKEGKIVKRNGWIEQYKLDNRIDSITEIHVNGNAYILAYSGKRFYLINENSISDITESGQAEYRVDTENLSEGKLTVFQKEGIYYIVGAGVYLSLGDFGNGIELRSVKKYAYIPTTTIGIMPEGKTIYVIDKTLDERSRGIWYVKGENGYTAVALSDDNPWDANQIYYNRVASYQMQPVKMEEANILTEWRKNTLYGVNSWATYKLDSENIARNKDLRINLKVLENGEINEYVLKEIASGNLLRGIEKGDNLKGKTITVTANTTPIYASGLQNGMNNKGKTLLKSTNCECFWHSSGVTTLGWGKAKLIFKYKNNEGSIVEKEIAEATRQGLYGSYDITYKDEQFTLSGASDDYVEISLDSAMFSEQVRAMLPSYSYNLLDNNLLSWGSLNHKTGVLNFVKATTSPDGGDNIEVLFQASATDYNADAIDKCTLAVEYGVDGNTDRLFLSGNCELQNLDFASDSGDFTYFPTDYVYKFGLDGTKITSYARLADDSLAIFKDTVGGESNLYIRRGKFVNKTIYIGDNSYSFKKAEFTISGSYLSNSSINGRLNKIFDGEPIFLTERGVYTLKSNIDLMNEQKKSLSRGSAVDGLILSKIDEVKDAVIYNNDYYLQVGKTMYIAKCNSYHMVDNFKQYNWWVYKDVPACVLAVINGELWFGTDEGRICKFSSGFSDIYYDLIESGNFLFKENDKYVAFSERLRLRKGERLLIEGELYAKLFDNVAVVDGKVKVDDVLRLGEIDVYVDNETEELSKDVAYEIKNVNTDDNTFELYKDGEKVELTEGGFRLSVRLDKKILTVNELRFSLDASVNDVCTFLYLNKTVVPIRYDERAIPTDIHAKIVRECPVIALWRSHLTDLKSPETLKNLYTVGVDLGENTAGKINLLIEGKHSINMIDNSWDMVDLAYPNLSNFSFVCKGEKSIYAHTRFRGINQASFTVISDEAKPFELKGLYVEYSLLKDKRGVIY